MWQDQMCEGMKARGSGYCSKNSVPTSVRGQWKQPFLFCLSIPGGMNYKVFNTLVLKFKYKFHNVLPEIERVCQSVFTWGSGRFWSTYFLFPKHKVERMPPLLEIDGRHFA